MNNERKFWELILLFSILRQECPVFKKSRQCHGSEVWVNCVFKHTSIIITTFLIGKISEIGTTVSYSSILFQPLVRYLKVTYAIEHTAATNTAFFSLDFHALASSSLWTFFFMLSTRFVILSFLSALLRRRISVAL